MRPTQYVLPGIVVSALAIPSPAAGQSSVGPIRVGGLVSGSIGVGNSATTVGISASYRFAPRLAVEIDWSHMSDLTLVEISGGAVSWHAKTSSATVSLVSELPTGVPWLRPYLAGGGGAAGVRRDVRGDPNCRVCQSITRWEPVLSLGGGLDVRVWRGLALGVDVRYQRVFEDPRSFRPNLRNLTRIGSVVSYRF